jgi:broad specificity phosphatase PhoE
VSSPVSITLVRHGETVGESSIRYHGANDVALSDHGREQMRGVATALRAEHFDLVLTSCMQRSTEAALLIAPGVPVRAVRGFDEIDFGDWEGLTAGEIEARRPDLFRRWRSEGVRFTYPGGDSILHFRERVAAAFRALEPELPARTLVVAHKGVIATLLAVLRDQPLDAAFPEPIDLGSIHVLERGDTGWDLVVANGTAHLEGIGAG